MAGFTPDEGETLILNYLYERTLTDRDADMELGLFTNSSPGETITEAALTEPSGAGYARITLTDADWSISAGFYVQPQKTFTTGAGGWTGASAVQGYFICTKSAGGTQRLLHIEVDPGGPRDMSVEGSVYRITPKVSLPT